MTYHTRASECSECHRPLSESANSTLEIVTGICNACRDASREELHKRIEERCQ